MTDIFKQFGRHNVFIGVFIGVFLLASLRPKGELRIGVIADHGGVLTLPTVKTALFRFGFTVDLHEGKQLSKEGVQGALEGIYGTLEAF